jgi:hypothetical protein
VAKFKNPREGAQNMYCEYKIQPSRVLQSNFYLYRFGGHMPLFFTFYFYFSIYDTWYSRFTSHNLTYMMRRAFVSEIAGIIQITSHSCDEAEAGWVLAWNW